ncbi:MAG: LLM class flavin-dependent oxidoreductase [Acidimicrobiales bacterium]|jgi:luciferase family oxidoreductase group 1|nr:LLM class flavin-dependent oxidoreductase [Acidimicrobiales bacterium]MDP6299140.1 LLM class flavin-dependent oxidoreductase [Acidimicrobiales bacterium]HJM29424.1 LLM class flavin-dependent oxidoreductase [Acidimicrobiales bacterium]HJM98040.1 LLM class flavin-dependent oxidoreductase [Acidimicrobiales bacterium]
MGPYVVRLSVLDQSPVPEGTSPSEALRNSIDLAVLADELGFYRYWVAEHHGMHGLAGSSPEILIGHIAENTDRIRVGSGGVMLSHYSSLKVAENFQVLEALHPNRIDMGLGRAPGSDARTAYALQSNGNASGSENYLNSVLEIRQLLRGLSVVSGPLAGIEALPKTDSTPEMWLLASSEGSASVAAHCGLPLSWAHFINGNGAGTCNLYREHYSPSDEHPTPEVSVGVSVLCADTEDEAQEMLQSLERWRSDGLRGPIPKTNSDRNSPNKLKLPDPNRPMVVGTPDHVRQGLEDIAKAYASDELLLVSICHDHSKRLNSYRLIAEAFKN